MRKVVVIGSEGQLATALAALSWPEAQIACLGPPAFDLTLTDAVAARLEAQRPDAVINAAAYTAVDRAETDLQVVFALNRDGPAALARACAMFRVPLIHVSTDYVFDGAKGSAYVEQDRRAPLGAYGRSKAEGEDAVLAFYPDATVVRSSWVFSATGTNFVKTMLRLAREGRREIGVVADQRGRPTYAADLAGACRMIVEARWRDRSTPPVLHVANEGEAVWADVAEAVFAGARKRGAPAATVKRITTADYPTAAPRPLDSRLDTRLFEETFATRLRPWAKALDECLDLLVSATYTGPERGDQPPG